MKMPRDFPRRNELVVATVKRVEEHGVIAELEEYDGLEAYIPRGHVASGRIKDIRDFVKEGDRVVGRVIRADRARQQVDLSLRYVSKEQAERKLREWKERSRALSLIRVAAARAGVRNPEETAKRILARIEDVYESALEALEDALGHPEVLDKLGVPTDIAEQLVPLIREQLKPPLYIKEVTLKLVSPSP
ncbi:MAG TPA: S1 RNA-binding domain-containing protein, partial [Candidatus Korarchaeota archaeon]|nr:S1 RNA-binding domain-containing protein [Candidatus Korarchaeota archaeon]